MPLRPLIAGNWKMNGLREEATTLVRDLLDGLAGSPGEAEVLVCPPFTRLESLAGTLAGTAIALGAQDCHAQAKGAFTGDISAPMLAEIGCRYVIVGHSERRQYHGEGDAAVRDKAEAALAAGLVPIVCVGESEAQRDAGEAVAVVRSQVSGSLPQAIGGERLVVAYEPVWAIGTGKTARPEDVRQMHAAIREQLRAMAGAEGDGVRLLYGGSVKPENAAELLAIEDVDGALVGGASLKARDFLAIVAAA